ncbi:hypothetical protein [Aquabacterium sp.]|uniref:hypothetical protein n=1 Tax=Aquabacterium sp. TaxID=1872578 RepID=UPI002487EDFB|nr:hypothetical protein [Aquabacterium sp.]MDI1348866.1 hypothetical protein [Aquabacterium sp.]
MLFHFVRLQLPLTLAMFASAVAAQTPTVSQTNEANPLLARPLQYRSLISTYEPYNDQAVRPWREANDRVQRIGGWRTYAKEVSDKAPASADSGTEGHSTTHGGVKP